ncbi:MAG: hypothetical protein ACYDB2_07375 [Acidimicrobiales bacterium]
MSAATSLGRAYFARYFVLEGAVLRAAGLSTDSHEPKGSGVRDRLLASPSSWPVLLMLIAPLRATLPHPLSRARSPASCRFRCSGVSGAGVRARPYVELAPERGEGPRNEERREVVSSLALR